MKAVQIKLTQIKKHLWKGEVIPVGRQRAILTRYGKTEVKAESACLDVAYKKKNWNLVSLSKNSRIEGSVGVSVSELFGLNKSTLPGFLSRRLATGLTLRDVKYWPMIYLTGRG